MSKKCILPNSMSFPWNICLGVQQKQSTQCTQFVQQHLHWSHWTQASLLSNNLCSQKGWTSFLVTQPQLQLHSLFKSQFQFLFMVETLEKRKK